MTNTVQIGDWSFSPSAAELRRGGERVALEDRAARVLALLAGRRGEVVTQDELIAQVWGGRSVSANSVAVVIGDLRRALGDDAKAPRFIETIAKRGYRLALQESAAPSAPARPPWLIGLAAASAAFVFAGALVASRMQAAEPAHVLINAVSNETGDTRYAPLARAVTELVVSDTASGAHALRSIRSGEGDSRDVHVAVNGRLIMWSGHPSVSLSAVDRRSGQVLWSGIAPGPEDDLPAQVGERVEDLKRVLSR